MKDIKKAMEQLEKENEKLIQENQKLEKNIIKITAIFEKYVEEHNSDYYYEQIRELELVIEEHEKEHW